MRSQRRRGKAWKNTSWPRGIFRVKPKSPQVAIFQSVRLLSLSIISIISILVNDDMALEIPKNFGCKNSMISDDWRRAVLNYHNTLRKKVAEGKQRTNGNKANMLYATKMNELTWDCGLEHNAWLNLCDSNVKIDQDYTETTKTALNTKGTPCNVTARTLDILKAFSKESNEEDLSAANPTRTDKIANFAVMAAEAAKGFACTYQKCTGDTVTNFVCLYDTKMVANNQIYTTDADVTKICDACAANGNNAKCISHLCQYEYTLGKYLHIDRLGMANLNLGI
ncbi:hypothetical protein Y032_0505g2671 [Ancylostoma ceylanicum]|uniref:SCP domain-containing protein n=1 Tax=Ancylostoma ceylanicum TaxID=53326 RepID=A0A016WVQ0_9BILA|nr:hypothetical protein Y032_0505g2671 [Ancylostoma ceylanicum]